MKKYSDKFLNQSNKLKNARIGFEFEFYMKDLSYYKTLELLNQELSPVKVWGFRQYHSDFTPDANNFKIEPDLSGGSYMVELVTGPLDYFDAKYYLVKIIKFIQTYGYTIKSDFFNTPWFRLNYMYGYFNSDRTKFSYQTTSPSTFGLDGVDILSYWNIPEFYGKKRGWTWEETEEHGWKSWRHLQRIEAGQNFTVHTLWKICRLYGIKVCELFKNM